MDAERLREQLDGIIEKYFVLRKRQDDCGDDNVSLLENSGSYEASRQLIKLFLSSHPDQLARKISNCSYIPFILKKGDGTGWVSTTVDNSTLNTREAYLNFNSCCNGKYFRRSNANTDWIVYSRLEEKTSGKLVISGCSLIEDARWIVEHCSTICSFSDPIINSAFTPHYDVDEDAILVRTTASISPSNVSSGVIKNLFSLGGCDFPLEKLASSSYKNSLLLYEYFGKELLEGKVIKDPFTKYAHLLTVPPHMMITMKQGTSSLSKCVSWRQALQKAFIYSRERLLKVWSGLDTKNYLLKEWLLWIPVELHSQAILDFRNKQEQSQPR